MGIRYKVICNWLLLVLALEVPDEANLQTKVSCGVFGHAACKSMLRKDAICLRDFKKIQSMS